MESQSDPYCVEFQVVGGISDYRTNRIVRANVSKRTMCGWYTKQDHLLFDIGRLNGVSGYVTFNPVHLDLLGRADNKIVKVNEGEGTKDQNIISIKWIYIDIDPVKSEPAMPATDAELGNALMVRDAILADHPSIRGNALWGSSGNGGWILIRTEELPNDSQGREVVANVLGELAERYGKRGRSGVFVDTNTKNPSRHIPIPGTYKCKGTDTIDRPWRLCTLDGGYCL